MVFPFSNFPPGPSRPLPGLLALYPLYSTLYLPSTDESYYPLTQSDPCPRGPLLPLLLLVAFINL